MGVDFRKASEAASLQTGYGSRRLDIASLLNHLPRASHNYKAPVLSQLRCQLGLSH